MTRVHGIGAVPVILPMVVAMLMLAACDAGGGSQGRAQVERPIGIGEDVAGRNTLVVNAKILTFDPGNTVIEPGAMAFSREGEIVALGDEDAMREAFSRAAVVDLGGHTVLPGLIDSHAHLAGLAYTYTIADLSGTGSEAEVIQRLQAFARVKLAPGQWLLGRGWDQNDWPEPVFPDRSILDAVFPDRPVWLERVDGHAGWANSAALAQADRDFSGDWQPEGGFIHRDAAGAPTGILVDGAMALIDEVVPPTPPAILEGALATAGQVLAGFGLTGVHDPGVGRGTYEAYRTMMADGRLPLRIYAMADGVSPTLEWLCEEGPRDDLDGRLQMRAVKLYADGALGSRGAALLADYSDDPGNRGLLFHDDAELQAQLRQVMGCGLQAAVHAIGDRANRQVLDAYERLIPDYPDNPGRHRIEHAQVLDLSDLPRFSQLGVIAAMQPTHATSDMYWADERLGPGQSGHDRLAGAYAWRSLLDSGAILAFGSDFPVEPVNPMLGIYAAETRQDLEGWPEGGWQPQERVSRVEAIRGFTLGAARAAFMEHAVGSLESGKRADFIVIDRDILQVPPAELPEIRVLQTWVDGVRVYERP